MKRTLALLLILALLSGCGGGTIPPPPENSVSDPSSLSAPPDDEASEPEEPEKPADPVEVLLKELSLEEKVGQLFFARCPAENAVCLHLQRRCKIWSQTVKINIQPLCRLDKYGQILRGIFCGQGGAVVFLAVKPKSGQGAAVAGQSYFAQR